MELDVNAVLQWKDVSNLKPTNKQTKKQCWNKTVERNIQTIKTDKSLTVQSWQILMLSHWKSHNFRIWIFNIRTMQLDFE